MNNSESSLNWRKLLIQALRAPFFTATLAAVFVGSAVAWNDGAFRWDLFFITLIAAVAVHAGTNVLNDYFDHIFRADDLQEHPTPFSGGSRVIQERKMSPPMVLWLAIGGYVITVVAGIWLIWLRGWPMLVIGLLGLFLSVEYTAPPLRLAYRGHGLGELATGIGFGPIMVVGTYFVQTGAIRPSAVWASLPIGFLIAAVLYINEFPDYEADREAGKNTIVVVQGPRGAVAGYGAIMLAAYATVVVGVLSRLMHWSAFLTFLTLPMTIRAISLTRRHYAQIDQLLPANAATIQVHSLFGLALATSFLLDRVFRLWLA